MAMMEIIPLDESTKNMVIALMNGEHPDAIRLYARHFGGKKSATVAILSDVSNKDLSLHFKTAGREEGDLTMPYVNRAGENITCETIGDCRRAMVGMARIASEALGEKIDLPEMKSTDLPGGDRAEGNGPPPPEFTEMIKQMRDAMAAKGPDTGEGAAGGTSSSSARPVAINKSTPYAATFEGTGNRLGGVSDSSGVVEPALPVAELREVDPEKPFLRLRVQLLDRKPAEITVNTDFSVAELRAHLDHYMGLTESGKYNLMEVSGFPPRKLTDASASLEAAGLTKGGCSLACRP